VGAGRCIFRGIPPETAPFGCPHPPPGLLL
jgi:hypothetical protein